MRLTSYSISAAGLVLGAAIVWLLPSRVLFSVSKENDHAAEATTGERWACPMMDFVGNRPGDCPVCGMKMTKVTAGELSLEQQRRMGVQLTTLGEGPARALVRAYGVVRYDDRTMQVVIPRIGGRIVKRHDAARHVGTLVAAGDPVIDIYSPELFAAQGELAAAISLGDGATVKALVARFERLNLGTIAKRIVDGDKPTDTVTITSPFAGRVVLGPEVAVGVMGNQLPQIGQEVMAETPLLLLVEPAAYMIAVQVPESRAHWVHLSQPVRLATDDRGELPEIEASVTWIAPELNQEIRSREVHVHLRDPKGLLMPGSLVSARFESVLDPTLHVANADQPDTWGKFVLIPKTAVISTGVRHVAWRVAERHRDGRLKFELAPLALGPRLEDENGNDLYVVRAGLKPGDEVATQGVFLIDSQAQLAGTPSLLFPKGAVAPAAAHQH